MRYLKSILLAFLVSALLVAGLGFALNPRYKVERSVLIHAPADSIYPYLANLKKWPSWSPWNSKKDPTIKFTYKGSEASIGARQEWTGEMLEKGVIEIKEMKPPKQIIHSLQMADDLASKGTLTLDPQGKNTTVGWTIEGDAGSNLPQRYFILFIEKFVGPDMEEGLLNLKKIGESE